MAPPPDLHVARDAELPGIPVADLRRKTIVQRAHKLENQPDRNSARLLDTGCGVAAFTPTVRGSDDLVSDTRPAHNDDVMVCNCEVRPPEIDRQLRLLPAQILTETGCKRMQQPAGAIVQVLWCRCGCRVCSHSSKAAARTRRKVTKVSAPKA